MAGHAHTRVELTYAVIKFTASRGQMGIHIGKKLTPPLKYQDFGC